MDNLLDISDNTQPSNDGLEVDPILGATDIVAGDTPEVQSQDKKEETISEAERSYRALQSKYDQTVAQLKKKEQVEQFLLMLDQDEEVRKAFFTKYYPDVFKQSNSAEKIKETLQKEFGEDFEDKLVNGSPLDRMMIEERWRELRQQMNQMNKIDQIKPIEQVLEERRKELQKQQEQLQRDIEEAKEFGIKNFNATDEDWKSYVEWAAKLKPKDLYYTFLKAKKSIQQKSVAPNPTAISSQTVVGDQIFKELDNIFGQRNGSIF